ncbi:MULTISPECIES: TauD/TfdA family dioxygenase [Legionella]|uniref:Taurine catabolism dioxygenase TauD, TfdA family n=1 Tax=Legionella drozanskii LLAP-1 TaxID=1212489 RepID=A0A0W0TC81_9GAMM|nr:MULTISPECIES: TauD/TfdA family dioxygenase [Legionella]KTC93174.1 Taurine catabolism dioxygenase TauD, TfdA family [Legionella drozanskii LLAP-1]PJE14176.1 MAG: hypothetical protein CK430_05490 [Legionella sp.]
MLCNLKEIQTHISSESYCSHPGKPSELQYLNDIDIQDYNLITTIYKNGFAVLNVKDKPLLSILRNLSKVLGRQVKDGGINKKYVAKIEAAKNGKFYINTVISQPLHMDEGYRKVFPRFVSLYCIRPSQVGGLSTIVKVSELLNELSRVFKEDMDKLFQPNFIEIDTACGKVSKQILFYTNTNAIGMSYSPMFRDIKTSSIGYEIISFINHFIHDPNNQYRLLLKENDLLLMDNCQVFHGRTAFNENDNRLLLRLWNDVCSL